VSSSIYYPVGLRDSSGSLAIFTAMRRPSRAILFFTMGFGIRTAPFKIDRPNPMVRTILMHGVAPQCAVK
jgi:hypothetical protein